MHVYPLIMNKLVMPIASRFTDLKIWDEYKKMMKSERLSLDELRHVQLTKLQAIVRHAYDEVPFYRQRFDMIGMRPEDIRDLADIERIPPTTKDDIMANFPEGITAQGMDRSRWKYVASSGTTRKIMGIHDFRKSTINWAAGIRAHKLAGNHSMGMKWMEIPPHMCTTICGINDGPRGDKLSTKKLVSLIKVGDLGGAGRHVYESLYSMRHDLYKRVTLPSFGSEGTNIPESDIVAYLNAIRDYKPHLLEGLPLYLYTFAKYIIDKGIPAPRVGVVKPFGGSLTPHMKVIIAKAFGCEVYDTYGCSELGFIACDCPKHEGVHLFMELFHLEVRNGDRVASPGELGKFYITDLENRAMPWIRYEIGDVGRYFEEDHGCGRGSIRLQVDGRVQDTLANSQGKFFTSDEVFDFFHVREEIDNFQLTEKSPGRFELLCVPAEGKDVDREGIARDFREYFDQEAFVKAYLVKTIKAEDGGKFRFIKAKGCDRL
jgi:phenylacetate-CoA ligase